MIQKFKNLIKLKEKWYESDSNNREEYLAQSRAGDYDRLDGRGRRRFYIFYR